MLDQAHHDVVVVGASLAGCTAARLLAQRGLRVALVEQYADPFRHKRLCTHYIPACAVPTVQRLGLEPLIEAAGGVRSRMEIWTRWGWIRHGSETARDTYGYSIRRQTLDPIVRQLAADTPGVDLQLGWTACDVLRERERPVGVSLRDTSGRTRNLRARLVVAADGRSSPLARLSHVPATIKPNGRFIYFAYFRGLKLSSGNDAQFWMLDPDAAYALPNEDGIALVACWPTKDQLLAFRADRERAFEAFIHKLPSGPAIDGAERVSEIVGAIDLSVELRGGTSGGLALVGDAALAPDPLWGVGCGWAFQSAQWLADCVAPALVSGGDLPSALRRYHRRHRFALIGHYAVMANYSSGRRFTALEKLYLGAAVRDPRLADTVLAFSARCIGVTRLLSPPTLARAVWSGLRTR
jgi:2-polyprenyl-6-methoxyphenol hydroxylase-like FAD-dependent oxidoreductase